MSLAAALEFAVRTDPGRVRHANEDSLFVNPHQGLAILADGIGGHNAGEVASGMATTLLATGIEASLRKRPERSMTPLSLRSRARRAFARRCLRSHIESTNAAIFAAGQSQSQYAGMGTTLLAVLFRDDRIAVAHVGDSRLYRLRGDDFVVMTRDHSLLQEQIDLGWITAEDARHADERHLLTRALGVDREVEVDISEHVVAVGDIYLLCSDGLNAMLDDDEICSTLRAPDGDLELAAAQLIEMARDRGGYDNVSVILVRVRSRFPAAKGRWLALATWLKQDNRAG
jgi:protein phosphatase